MKMILLAAGMGTRLMPLTNDMPKCMVKYKEKPLIDYILQAAGEAGICDISLVCGYKKEALKAHLANTGIEVKIYENNRFDATNMVYTLFCAEDEFADDMIISYTDIIYRTDVLEKLIHDKSEIAVVIDKDWLRLWEMRMENPLDDAETLVVGKDGQIMELGKKPENITQIQGQYIGLIKIPKAILPEVIEFYKALDKNILYDGQPYDKMYMTSFLQLLIDAKFDVKAVDIHGGWVEIDSLEDLENLKDYEI